MRRGRPTAAALRRRWYRGTADAVFQNVYALGIERPDLVLILAGDHVYKLDYSEMLDAHLASGAEVTIACAEVPVARRAASA